MTFLTACMATALLLGQDFEPEGLLGDNVTMFHAGNVLAVAHFPDGKLIVSSTDTRDLDVWDTATGALVARVQGSVRAQSLAVTADGKQIVAGGGSGDVTFFAWPGLKPGRTVSAPGGGPVVVSRNAARAVAQSRDKICFLDLDTGKVQSESHRHAPSPASLRIAVSPDGELAASADGSGVVRLWKTATAKSLSDAQVPGDGNFIRIGFSGDGKSVVARTNRTPASVLDTTKPAEPVVWTGYGDVFETANHAVVLGLSGDALVAMDPATRRELGRFDRAMPDQILPGAVSNDQKSVAVVLDSQSLQLLQFPSLAEIIPLKGPWGRIFDLDLSPKGDKVAATAIDGSVHVWDLGSKQLLRRIDGRFNPAPHQTAATTLRWSKDGVALDCLGTFNSFRCIAASGVRTTEAKVPTGGLYRTPVPDGDSVLIATGTSFQRVLSQSDNRVAAAFTGPFDTSMTPAFTPDGAKALFKIDSGNLGLVDVAKGRLLKKVGVKSRATDRVLLSPDGENVIVIDDAIYVTSIKSGKEIAKIELAKEQRPQGQSAQAHALSPDGTLLALSFHKPDLFLFNLSTGMLAQTLSGPRSMLQSAEFSRDGKRLLAAGWDRAVHVWVRK
jgi:WD40 repeat protein